MHNYELINNHYLVEIDGKRLLVDTGSPTSFLMESHCQEITIDGVKYALQGRTSHVDVAEMMKLVGVKVDGFIGLDIIRQTSLTIHKNGLIEFRANDVDGKGIDLNTNGFLTFSVESHAMSGAFIIDTGAKYGYGIRGLFDGLKAFDHVEDYNPILGRLNSDLYHLDMVVGGRGKVVDLCDNADVYPMIKHYGAVMIANITSLFDEVCVIDVKKGTLTLK